MTAELSRLCRGGELRRLRKGVYLRPKETVLGAGSVDPERVVDALLRARSVRWVRGGRGEYHRLGLTTQVPNLITRAAERRVRLGEVQGIPVRVYARPLHAQAQITGAERTALDALREPTAVPAATAETVLRRMKQLCRSGALDGERLARYARAEPPRVRALLGALAEDLAAEDPDHLRASTLAGLRASLNPLTTYRVEGLGDALAHAEGWQIIAA